MIYLPKEKAPRLAVQRAYTTTTVAAAALLILTAPARAERLVERKQEWKLQPGATQVQIWAGPGPAVYRITDSEGDLHTIRIPALEMDDFTTPIARFSAPDGRYVVRVMRRGAWAADQRPPARFDSGRECSDPVRVNLPSGFAGLLFQTTASGETRELWSGGCLHFITKLPAGPRPEVAAMIDQIVE